MEQEGVLLEEKNFKYVIKIKFLYFRLITLYIRRENVCPVSHICIWSMSWEKSSGCMLFKL